jgi:hypothetical protein
MYSNKDIVDCIQTKILWAVFKQKYYGLYSNKDIEGCIQTKILWAVFKQKYCGLYSNKDIVGCIQTTNFDFSTGLTKTGHICP